MPKKSKRVAAKQAALSRKKKSSKPNVYRPARASSGASVGGSGAVAIDQGQQGPVKPGGALPEFEVPTEDGLASPSPVKPSSRMGAEVVRRGTAAARMPYLRSDLAHTARVGVILVIALIVLAIVL